MVDRNKTKVELIQELEQLRQENRLLKVFNDINVKEADSRDLSSPETKLALLKQGEKLTWWEIYLPSGKIIFDPQEADIMGYTPEKFNHYTDLITLIHPDDYQQVIDALNGYIEGIKDKFEVEFRMLTPSDDYIWLFNCGTIVKYDLEGKPLIMAGTIYNINERRQKEEVLYKNKQMLEMVMDNFPGVVFWKDEQLSYLGCNQTFAKVAGLNNRDEIVGKSDFDLPWGLENSEKYRTEDFKVIKSGKAVMHMVDLYHHINGKISSFDTNKFPLRDSLGNIMGVLGLSNDISKLTAIEKELINANNKLSLQNEQKVGQAQELEMALKKAEESDQLKSDFLANMSHEIRTPMNSILGFSQLLKDPDLTPKKQQDFILIIENSVERMLNIINDIVDFSTIESGQMKVYNSKMNVNQEIENICNFYYSEAKSKGIQIFIQNPLFSGEATITTDRDKFCAILTNLMKNAIKFTRSGSIEIGYEKKGYYLEFYVKDTGIGVTDSQKEIIFKKFRQGSETENKKYAGAGLGLSISKAYVELLGGKIWVESSLSKGSEFYFTLPYNIENEKERAGIRLIGSNI